MTNGMWPFVGDQTLPTQFGRLLVSLQFKVFKQGGYQNFVNVAKAFKMGILFKGRLYRSPTSIDAKRISLCSKLKTFSVKIYLFSSR